MAFRSQVSTLRLLAVAFLAVANAQAEQATSGAASPTITESRAAHRLLVTEAAVEELMLAANVVPLTEEENGPKSFCTFCETQQPDTKDR